MLIDKINACTSSINELSTLRSADLSLKTYEASVNKLTTVGALVADFVSTVDEMNKHDFCKTNLSGDDLEKMREAITTCAAAVNNMSLNNNDVVSITTVFQSQKKVLALFWQTNAKAYVEPIRSYLGIIQTFAENKEEISNLIKVLNTGATAEPSPWSSETSLNISGSSSGAKAGSVNSGLKSNTFSSPVLKRSHNI